MRTLNSEGTVSTYLDISNKVYNSNSLGFLVITLDPQVATNRFPFLIYTASAEAGVTTTSKAAGRRLRRGWRRHGQFQR